MELTIGQMMHKALSKQLEAMERFPALGESRTEKELDEIYHLMTEVQNEINAACDALAAMSKAINPD